ncbi:glutathione S-transferase-like [Vespula squamosa]|uniref:glutathione transferase n=1 Tax=Vespula squamosa TaxID=30214 RepID=A0ABD2ASI9_VESSQ
MESSYILTGILQSVSIGSSIDQYRSLFTVQLLTVTMKYKLSYFNVMGLGEPIRFLLSYGGADFEDIRIDREQWEKFKPATPFGQMPILEFDGKIYSQTLPICRYLAKKYNLNGKTDLDDLQIDAIANAIHDLRKQVALFYRSTDPNEKAKKKEEVLTTVLPFYLKKLEELARNNGGYLHGSQLSYADLFFVAISDSINNACGLDIGKDNPNLKSLREKVLAIPKIKEWIQKRPKLEF